LFQKYSINQINTLLAKLMLQCSILFPIILVCRPGPLPRYIPHSPISCSPCQEHQGGWIKQVVHVVIEVFFLPFGAARIKRKKENMKQVGGKVRTFF
jgi:hypothetical protein